MVHNETVPSVIYLCLVFYQRQPEAAFVPFKVLPAKFPSQILPDGTTPRIHFWEELALDALYLNV